MNNQKVTNSCYRFFQFQLKQNKNPNYWDGHTEYNPLGILFTKKEWNLFRKECNEIFLVVDAPKRKVGVFDKDPDDYMGYKDNLFTGFLRELRDAPMKDWIFHLETMTWNELHTN